MSEPYKRYREIHEDISNSLVVGSGTNDSTLVTAKSQDHRIYIQKYHVQITGSSSGKTWSLEDSADTPVSISGALAMDAAPASFERDFGAKGVPLTTAKHFLLNVSATGAAGIITWEGYMRTVSSFSLFVSR